MKINKILESLTNYENGFFRSASKTATEAYKQRTAEVKARIENGAEPLEDIIYSEQQRVAKEQLRASFTNDGGNAEERAKGYWSAVELIRCSLTDSKPL